jgi:regulatory protein
MRNYSESALYEKMSKWCAFRDRSAYETDKKLRSLGCKGEDAKKTLDALRKEGFLDDERFAQSYVSGKFRISKWGKLKIIAGLRQQHISDDKIRRAIAMIPEDDYLQLFTKLLQGKLKAVKGSPGEAMPSIFRFLSSRGFESRMITEHLKPSFPDITNPDY